jgi:hypothetical protein
MSVGQRVRFTKTVEVAANIVAHPNGILEITRHSDFHQLQKLFGPAKGINGHSDAEVMLYLLAVETGWFDKFAGQCPPSAHATPSEVQAWQLENFRQNPVIMESHTADVPPMGRTLDEPSSPVVIERGVARPPREGEKPHGYAQPAIKPTLRVADRNAPQSISAAEFDALDQAMPIPGWVPPAPIRPPFDVAEPEGQRPAPTYTMEALRKRVVLYAESIGCRAERDGRAIATEDLVFEIFGRIAAGGEAKAGEILPDVRGLKARWIDAGVDTAKAIDDAVGACQRALAIWIARENFALDRARETILEAERLLLDSQTLEDSERMQWFAKRDAWCEAARWTVSDVSARALKAEYHPAYDAEEAFNVLHAGLGHRDGSFRMPLKNLAKEAIARIKNQATEAVTPAMPPQPQGMALVNLGGVVGGPQRPSWHSGTGQGTGVF